MNEHPARKPTRPTKGFRFQNYMLVEITIDDMNVMLKKKIYGVPVYIAFDNNGKCYVYPLAHTES